MRTSFHHQPEAQHPNFSLSVSWQADYPIFRGANRKTCAHSEPYRFWPRRSFGSFHSTCLSALVRRPRDGSVVSSPHCMNDPQPEGSHGKLHPTTKILSHARRRGSVAACGVRSSRHADDRVGEVTMRRREFIGLLASIAISPHAVLAQTTKKRPLVGWLSYGESDVAARYLGLLLKGMRELGLIEGRDFEMVYRSANFQVERLPKAAEELVQLNPDIIIAPATLQAVAAKKATDTIPIVVPVLADPVGLGFVASEARPGGNVTGIAPYVKGLPAKQLELAREVVPGATRIGLVDDVNDPKAHPQRREIEAAGKELEIKIVPAEVRTASDIGSAYDALAVGGVQVVVVEQSNMLIVSRKQIAEAAAAKKLPTVYGYREHVEAGGLISYGVNLNSCFHRAAYYVDKILKGTKPGDLPVEFPTSIELVINLKAAKSLALQISPTLIARADEVIE